PRGPLARRRPLGRGAGGGGGIPALRAPRARLTTAAAACGCWAVAAVATGRGDALFVPFALLVDLAAGALLLLALARAWGAGVGWALVLSVLAYLLAGLAGAAGRTPSA